ncbi:MAG: DNA repair protein RadC [Tissierellia bacterium]|nr:DNA repair protein RadC [Tissierellia bacterium]
MTIKRNYSKVQERHEHEKPREKLMAGGEDLSDEELAAILLRTGSSTQPVMELAEKLMRELKNHYNPIDITVEELIELKGIGPAKACTIIAALQLGQRLTRLYQQRKIQKINRPDLAAELVRCRLPDQRQERFYALLLDTKNQLITIDEISKGSLNASIVHPREAFRLAIRRSANAIIFAHNHPSGDRNPSREDISVTKRLAEAGNILGIQVHDHIIVTQDDYLSMKEENYF